MTDPITPQIHASDPNTASEITKKLFSPVDNELDMQPKEEIKIEPASENNNTTDVDNKEDWLKNEDNLIEQANTEIDKPSPNVPNTSTLFRAKPDAIESTNIPNPEINKVLPETETSSVGTQTIPLQKNEEVVSIEPKLSGEKTQQNSLAQDMQIIENIQKVQTQNISVDPKTNTSMTQKENVFNLDTIELSIPIPQVGKGSVEIPKPQIPENPYDNLQKIIPQIMPSIKKISTKETKYIGIGVAAILVILAWFVIKTMYPIQYQNGVDEIAGSNDEVIVATEDSIPLTGELVETGNIVAPEVESGNILLDSGNNLLDPSIIESLSGEIDHSAAGTGSEELTIQSNTESIDSFKTKLEEFVAQGKIALEDAKKTNNKEGIKYSTIVYKKAQTQLQDLANGQEISTGEMTNILGELGSYLAKIGPNTDANISASKETETTGVSAQQDPIQTSGGEFNPESFFGN